jgi:hypothetical protein
MLFIQCIIVNAPMVPASPIGNTIHPSLLSPRPIAASIPWTGNGVWVSKSL